MSDWFEHSRDWEKGFTLGFKYGHEQGKIKALADALGCDIVLVRR